MNAAPARPRRRIAQYDGPDPIDVFVGLRMRERRTQQGLSLHALSRTLGVSYQAAQKYEVAQIRLAASNLYRLSQALGVAPGYFFEGYVERAQPIRRRKAGKR